MARLENKTKEEIQQMFDERNSKYKAYGIRFVNVTQKKSDRYIWTVIVSPENIRYEDVTEHEINECLGIDTDRGPNKGKTLEQHKADKAKRLASYKVKYPAIYKKRIK